MNISLIVELVLSALLLATIVYCAILERRLSALRKGQDGLKTTITHLNEAITAAGSSMRMLKSTAAGAADALDERITRGRSVADELSLLVALRATALPWPNAWIVRRRRVPHPTAVARCRRRLPRAWTRSNLPL